MRFILLYNAAELLYTPKNGNDNAVIQKYTLALFITSTSMLLYKACRITLWKATHKIPNTKEITKLIINNCEADSFVFSSSLFPRYCVTITEPPPAIAVNIAIIRLFTSFTMDTPEIAASPAADTMIVSAIPTSITNSCSTNKGRINLPSCRFVNILFFIAFMLFLL